MKKLLWAIAVGLMLAGCYIQFPPVQEYAGQAVSWLYASKPVTAVVVRETADAAKLTKEQIAWLSSPKLRADCKTAGVQFLVVDKDLVDAAGKTPPALAPAIERAKKAGLPRLILVGSRGGITDYALPATESDARKRLGI
jgi:hypothetical protein